MPKPEIVRLEDLDDPDSEIDGVDGDHQVPPDLLELYVELDNKGVTPEEFKEVYGDAGTGSKA